MSHIKQTLYQVQVQVQVQVFIQLPARGMGTIQQTEIK